jgi:hypothetical protein
MICDAPLRHHQVARHNGLVTASGAGAAEGGDLLPRVIADSAAALADLPFGPAGPFVTAATAPYLERVSLWAWDKFGEDSKNRISGMLGRAWHASGLSAIKFAGRIGRSEQTRLLTATAMTGAATTAWPPRVRAIGNLLAKGLVADDEDEIDLITLALAAMAEMGRPHVMLLDLLVNFAPYFTVASSEAQPYSGPRSGRGGWQAGRRIWTADQIRTVEAPLKPALTGLIGTLVRHGLAVENNDAAAALQKTVEGFERRGREQARQTTAGARLTADRLRPHIPEVPRVERTWSPTELGEYVLGLYHEAAGEGERDVADGQAE